MRVSDHCYAVLGFGFSPPWLVNAGFIVGRDRVLMVDSGPQALAAESLLGYARAVAEGKEFLAINTEAHIDHISGNATFHRAGIPIYAHEKAVRDPGDIVYEIAELDSLILEDFRRKAGEANLFFRDSEIYNAENKISGPTSFELGDLEVRVLLSPGHTPANMLVWVEKDGTLYCGDTLTEGWIPNTSAAGSGGLQKWLQSLELVRSLDPQVIVPGHGRPIRGRDQVNANIERVADIVRKAMER